MSARRLNDPAARAEDWGRPVPEDSDFGSADSRGGPRGRGRDGRVHEGRGRGTGRGRGGVSARPDARAFAVDNSAGEITDARPLPDSGGADAGASTSTGGIVGGLGGYASDPASDASSSSESSDSSSSESGSDDSDSENEEATVDAKKEAAVDHSPGKVKALTKPVCRFFAKNGKCRFGDKCQYSHVSLLPNPLKIAAKPSRMWCRNARSKVRNPRSIGSQCQSSHPGRSQILSRGHLCWELFVL